jgi:nitrate reductase delta subunit
MERCRDLILDLLAEAIQYPTPLSLERLQCGIQVIGAGAASIAYKRFVEAIQRLSLGEWEELYTRTFDLDPAVAPYVGYQIWGDGYPRGKFLATLRRVFREAGLDTQGELPDHLGCVLNFLATGATPPTELVEAFNPALQKMMATLRKNEPHNPYNDLLQTVEQTVEITSVERDSTDY